MTAYRALIALTLLGLTIWMGWGVYLVGRDLWRRHQWNKRHFHFQRSTERWMAQWKTNGSIT